MKKFFFQNLLLVSATILSFVSCQKELSDGITNPGNNTTVDLGTKVRTSVSGFVTDENDEPVQGANVKVGIQTATTDEYGFFEARNVEVSKNAATVNVNKPGYFPGIRTYIATNNKTAFVRIKLLPKENAGTISAASGGTVTLTNGLKINLPANAVVNAASSAAYTGTVNIAAKWLDPTAADLDRIMPGDLRAIDEDNNMKLLVTYGMAAVELTSTSGEKLQVAPGKKAILTFPLPAAIAGNAPAGIPLWHFDEAIGLWREEGSARKVGNTYEGEVSHFSFWNCDVPNNYIQLDMTVKDPAGNPIPCAWVKITNMQSNAWANGYTNEEGYVKGAVPGDSTLKIEIYLAYNCGTPSYTQTITTGSTNVSLGTIAVNNTSNTASISGTLTNCNGQPVTNGGVLVKMNGWFFHYPVNTAGGFNISTVLCNGDISIDLIPEDNTAGLQGTLSTHIITTGNNALGNFQACGMSNDQFINLTVNGIPYSFTDSVTYNNAQLLVNLGGTHQTGTANWKWINILFSNAGIANGTTQPLSELRTNYIEEFGLQSSSTVTITEFGAIGQFISGTISATGTGYAPPNTTYNITGNFRVRRNN